MESNRPFNMFLKAILVVFTLIFLIASVQPTLSEAQEELPIEGAESKLAYPGINLSSPSPDSGESCWYTGVTADDGTAIQTGFVWYSEASAYYNAGASGSPVDPYLGLIQAQENWTPGDGWTSVRVLVESRLASVGDSADRPVRIQLPAGFTTIAEHAPNGTWQTIQWGAGNPPFGQTGRILAQGGSDDVVWVDYVAVIRCFVGTSTPVQTPTDTPMPTDPPTPTGTPTPEMTPTWTATWTPVATATPMPTTTPTSTPSPVEEQITVCNDVLVQLDENFGEVKSANFWETRPMTDTVTGEFGIVNVWAPEAYVASASGYDAPIVLEAAIPSDSTEIRLEGFYRGTSTTASGGDFLSVNVQVGTHVMANQTLISANSFDEWHRWRPWEYRFSVSHETGQTVRLEFFVHSQDWATSWFELDAVTISACHTEALGTPQIIEAGPIDQVYGSTAEELDAMGMLLVSHGTSAYATEFGKGLYSIEYMWKTSSLIDFPAQVLGGRPFPGVVQRGPNVPSEDSMWTATRADMAWKMAIRCVRQRCWTPEGNDALLQVLRRMRDANTWAGRDLIALERQIAILEARAVQYQKLTVEQLALLRQPIVAVWRVNQEDLIKFAEKSKQATRVVKQGYLLWRDVFSIEFPANTPFSIVEKVYRNIREAGGNPKIIVDGVERHVRYWKDYLPSITGTIAAIRTFGGSALTWTVQWGQSLARPIGAGLSELGYAGVIEAAIAAHAIVGGGDAVYDLWKWSQMENWETNIPAGDFATSNNMLFEVYMPSEIEWLKSPVTSQPSPVVVVIPPHGAPYLGRGVTPGYFPIPASQSFIWMRVKEVRDNSLVVELLKELDPRHFEVEREIELGKGNPLDSAQLTYWMEYPEAGMLSMTFDIRLWNYEGGVGTIEVRYAQTRAPEDYGCRPGWRPSLGESCLMNVAYAPFIRK